MKKKAVNDFLHLLTGGLIWAVSIDTFTVPNLIAPGGVSGLATVLNYFFRLPVGFTILLFNLPLFLLAFRKLGKSYILRTGLCVVLTSALIDGAALFLPTFTDDKLLAAILGGVLGGIGLGLIYSRDMATGGTDLLARLLQEKFPNISYGKLVLFFDGIVVLIAAVAFQDWISAIYAFITIYLNEIFVDRILDGMSKAKVLYIISEKNPEISDKVLTRLERGATALHAKGCYTKTEKDILMVVIRRYELPGIKNLIRDIDPNAFIIVGEVTEVLGEGFSRNPLYEDSALNQFHPPKNNSEH